jgi:hypothetical protein
MILAGTALIDRVDWISLPVRRIYDDQRSQDRAGRAGGYDRTIKFLPSIDNRPIPDAQHLVLQVLSLVVAITAATAVLRRDIDAHRS